MKLLQTPASLTEKSPEAQNLYRLREIICVSQRAMAALLACSKACYERYEAGTRKVPPYIAAHVKTLLYLHERQLLNDFLSKT
jgi:predicted transcriptional regulator